MNEGERENLRQLLKPLVDAVNLGGLALFALELPREQAEVLLELIEERQQKEKNHPTKPAVSFPLSEPEIDPPWRQR
jgi:hypothetical protein